MNRKIIIALDGCSSTGKSTMAKALARNLGYDYIDSGAMYRAVTLYALQKGYIVNGKIDIDCLKQDMPNIRINFSRDEDGHPKTLLNGRNVELAIRTPEVNEVVSPISALDFVREALTLQQKNFGVRRGIVMDGRDIGTTVFPDAELKVFVTCLPEVRAERRYKELKRKGIDITFEAVLANLLERDRIDSSRTVSPLAKADDAVVFDNSDLSMEQQDAHLLALALDKIHKQ